MQETIILTAIGTVENDFTDEVPEDWETRPSRIVIRPDLEPALDGIEGFSHLIILWWLHRAHGPFQLRVHPEQREDTPLVGFFATRTPNRPNPIAIKPVRLLRREGNVLIVEGLDALDGSPVIDIKPYLVRGDLVPEATVPRWLRELWAAHDAERSQQGA